MEWELDKTRKREQELKEAGRKLEKIESKVQSRKREQDGYKGAEVGKRRKKLNYNVEEESSGGEQITPAPNTMQLQGATAPPQPSPQKEEEEEGRSCTGATLHTGSIWKFAEREPIEMAGIPDARSPQTTQNEQDDSIGRSRDGAKEGKGANGDDVGGSQGHKQGNKRAVTPLKTQN